MLIRIHAQRLVIWHRVHAFRVHAFISSKLRHGNSEDYKCRCLRFCDKMPVQEDPEKKFKCGRTNRILRRLFCRLQNPSWATVCLFCKLFTSDVSRTFKVGHDLSADLRVWSRNDLRQRQRLTLSVSSRTLSRPSEMYTMQAAYKWKFNEICHEGAHHLDKTPLLLKKYGLVATLSHHKSDCKKPCICQNSAMNTHAWQRCACLSQIKPTIVEDHLSSILPLTNPCPRPRHLECSILCERSRWRQILGLCISRSYESIWSYQIISKQIETQFRQANKICMYTPSILLKQTLNYRPCIVHKSLGPTIGFRNSPQQCWMTADTKEMRPYLSKALSFAAAHHLNQANIFMDVNLLLKQTCVHHQITFNVHEIHAHLQSAKLKRAYHDRWHVQSMIYMIYFIQYVG